MKKWICCFLLGNLPLWAATPTPDKGAQLLLTATTEEYPDERSEIYVNADPNGWAGTFSIVEFEKEKTHQDQNQYTLEQINSKEGVVIKRALTVPLLVLKGENFNKFGGPIELRYRKSNWSDEYASMLLHLTRNAEGKWVVMAQDKSKDYRKLKAVKITVWKGIGFGIEAVEPLFLR